MNIRVLKSSEIECRVQSVKKTNKSVGGIMLLYKDARCDMKILDEVFGPLGWEREHQLVNGNLFCTVRVWDNEKKMWISKQDVGTESNTEKEKGQASDSFKRACFNLGIGRELYTAPFIWIDLKESEYYENNGKIGLNSSCKFTVSKIFYNDEKEIVNLEIKDSKSKVRYKLGEAKPLSTEWHTQNAEEFLNKALETSQSHAENNKTSSQGSKSTQNKLSSELKCESCGKEITEKIAMFSTSNFKGKKLCIDCQKKISK
ncbi:hypothetical protein [Clostridium sp. OS1-26]|uniref:hypothetical protein n=1 Tax=Clostridium sp. OS1-26 TaxID=3070681 RepID=UPI0027DEB0FC|nr:hypothetical protein [Clostridium sp. OS1-26]WML35377.1 hypothetical protein RCG18_01040 [Clostridium sp. OS1-26]